MTLRHDQKYVKWMAGVVSKYRKAKELMSKSCVRTFSTAKACLPLTEHYRFVICEKDFACFQDTLPVLMKISQSRS